jgi:hypothetical protein
MFFVTALRWELLRLGLDAIARVVAFDEVPTSARRSKGEHLRNGIGGLLFVASQVSSPRNYLAALWQTGGRKPARAELRYALSELRGAEPWRSGKRFASQHPWALLLLTSAGVALGDQIRRLRSTGDPDDVIPSAAN